MRKSLLGLLTMFFASPVLGAGPVFVGEWKSDRELTMQFVRERVRAEEKTYRFSEELYGRMTMSIGEDRIRYLLPDFDVEVEGKPFRMTGFDETLPYRIIHESEKVIVAVGTEPVTGNETITIYNFIGRDLMWIYTGGADKALPESHDREYFRRIH